MILVFSVTVLLAVHSPPFVRALSSSHPYRKPSINFLQGTQTRARLSRSPAPLPLQPRWTQGTSPLGRRSPGLLHRLHRNWIFRWLLPARRFPAHHRGHLRRRGRRPPARAAVAGDGLRHRRRSNRLLDWSRKEDQAEIRSEE